MSHQLDLRFRQAGDVHSRRLLCRTGERDLLREDGLAGAGGTRDDHGAASGQAASEHPVQIRVAGGMGCCHVIS